ncbi:MULTISPECIES: RICIN domain-containing protein [unclassified Streptomyces]|uniref:RICIN domain-containing protein n=1 Tax=unclassified Streptomyces TaxID=2593676 RepID=UPI0036E767C1
MATQYRSRIAFRISASAVTLSAACWGIGGSAEAAPRTPVSDGYHEIRVEHSNMCLDVGWQATHHGAGVVQANCTGGTNQQWKLEPLGGDRFSIKAQHSDKCLDVAWASRDQGAHVIQANCTGAANQAWGFFGGPGYERRSDGKEMPRSNEFYKLVALHSGHCLDVKHLSLANGASVIQAHCWAPGNNQKWRVM